MKTMITILPTLNRLKLLNNFLDSAIKSETSTSGIIVVDQDDWSKNEKHYLELFRPKDWNFEITKAVKMGDKIREVWHLVKNFNAVNLLNDDHLIKTVGWDQKLLKKIDGTNFVTCLDGKWEDRSTVMCSSPYLPSGATVWSMPLLEAVGIPIYPPGMKHLFIDNLWKDIGLSCGIWDIEHGVLIEHHNQLKKPNERDSTFRAVYGNGPNLNSAEDWDSDNKVYQDFMKNGFMEVRNKIRKLRGQLEITYNA